MPRLAQLHMVALVTAQPPPEQRLIADYVAAVWDVLVAECGAREEERQAFTHLWPECVEYRFIGRLGFGGKVWWNNDRIYVNYYPEDETNARNEMVQRANAKLSTLLIDGSPDA